MNSAPLDQAFVSSFQAAQQLDGLLAGIVGHLAEIIEKTATPGYAFIGTFFPHRSGHRPRCPQL